MLEMRLYITPDGKLCKFYVTRGEMMKLLNVSRKDIMDIVDAFKNMFYYYPLESKTQEEDFYTFINRIKDSDMRIKAAWVIDEAFKMANQNKI